MKYPILASSCPKPDTCRFTGCQGDCPPSFPAAAGASAPVLPPLLAREVPWRRPAELSFKPRDPLAQRRLLVAS